MYNISVNMNDSLIQILHKDFYLISWFQRKSDSEQMAFGELIQANLLKMEFRVTSLQQFSLAWINSNTFFILAYMMKTCQENDLKQLTSSEMTDIFKPQISSHKKGKKIGN